MKKMLIFVFVLALAAGAFAQGSGVGTPVPNPQPVGSGGTTSSGAPVSQAVQRLKLQASQLSYCVGQVPRYVLQGQSDVVGLIYWTSTYRPWGSNASPQAFQEGTYGQRMSIRPFDSGSISYWEGLGSAWTITQAGSWTKTATVGNESSTVTYEVNYCDSSVTNPNGIFVSPQAGSVLPQYTGLPLTHVIWIGFERLVDQSLIRALRVVANNVDITNDVTNPNNMLYGSMFEFNDARRRYYSPGIGMRLVIPDMYLQPGANQIDVDVLMQNGDNWRTGGEYLVRPMDVENQKLPMLARFPEQNLLINCPFPSLLIQYNGYGISADGGNGVFYWTAPGSSQEVGQGRYIDVSYKDTGTKTITVTSGSQKASCVLNVVVQPPMPAPPPTTTSHP